MNQKEETKKQANNGINKNQMQGTDKKNAGQRERNGCRRKEGGFCRNRVRPKSNGQTQFK